MDFREDGEGQQGEWHDRASGCLRSCSGSWGTLCVSGTGVLLGWPMPANRVTY